MGMVETIPFRDSKLTHIFKSYLTSSTHVCMVVNVSPDPFVRDSTLQVLQNSAIASNVIVFRPVDVNAVVAPAPLQMFPKEKAHKGFGTSEESDDEDEDDDGDYALPTVVAPKTMAQKYFALERENATLKEKLAASEAENVRIREEMLKMIVEERASWRYIF